jgi:hypothetical protein
MRLSLPHILLQTAFLMVALGLLSTASEAQFGRPAWQPRPWRSTPAAQLTVAQVRHEATPHEHPLVLVAGGVAGYVAVRGLFALTAHLAEGEGNCGTGFCGSTVAVVAAALAVPTLVPLGVHLANGGRGDLGADVLASTAVGLGVLLIGARSGVSAEGMLVAVPVGQILAAVATDIMVSRRPRNPPER